MMHARQNGITSKKFKHTGKSVTAMYTIKFPLLTVHWATRFKLNVLY